MTHKAASNPPLPSDQPQIEAEALRKILRHWASGVTIVTTGNASQIHGMTASSFISVSLDPPLVLVSLERESRTHALLEETQVYSVCILSDDQADLAKRFSRHEFEGEERFRGLAYHIGPSGGPILDHCLAAFDCALAAMVPAGTHSLMIGRVLEAKILGSGKPLVYYNREFHQVG